MALLMWEAAEVAAYEPSEQLRGAFEDVRAAEDAHAQALERLYGAIAIEVADEAVKTTDVARFLDYSAGHVRRIARDRGVPAKVDVEPPRRKSSSSDH
jgi:hypothetical protein